MDPMVNGAGPSSARPILHDQKPLLITNSVAKLSDSAVAVVKDGNLGSIVLTSIRSSHPQLISETIVTWLILPVVICLSVRLSHASLSISIYTVKLQMAHYISYSLFDGNLITWITVVILELIHA